jgi:branched-chain amino acid transport system ATP-binding protein
MGTGEPVLVLRGVSRAFGGLKAVEGVSMEIPGGETRVIIGPNGAGKTTLFGLISGELALTAGKVSLFGQDVSRWPAPRRARARLGRTYQITNVFGGLTVEENLLLALRGGGARKFSLLGRGTPSPDERATLDRILHTCGMADRRGLQVNGMSYGEQRQLELAIALAGAPRVLLLDEPAAGLSPAERVTMAQIIRELPAELTVVLIEHDMDLALDLADRVTCLHYGQVLVEGTPDEIRRDARVQEVYLGRQRDHARAP